MASRTSAPPPGAFAATAVVTLLVLASSGVGAAPVSAEVAVGTSAAGIVPFVVEGGPGGNVVCGQVPSDATLSSSDRLDWQGGSLVGDVPDGLEVSVVDDRSVTWSSEFPIVAVIVKGGPAANVYLATSALLADSALVAPTVASGQPADVSNVTFCWDPDPAGPPVVDLLQVCRDAAVSADVGPIVSVAGPIEIRDGAVVLGSVPDGLQVTYDAVSDQVGFVAPFPVVVVVTATSAHRIHHITPPSTSGTVPLSSNPGHGDVVLCGLDTAVVASVSCADIGADLILEAIPVRSGVIDPDDVPAELITLEMTDEGMSFVSSVPIVGVLVTASPSQLHRLDGPVLTGTVPMTVDDGADVELTFCALRLTLVADPDPTPVPDPDPTPDPTSGPVSDPTPTSEAVTTAQDPVLIATGGGPPARAPLALLAFVVLSLTGSATMLLWSRGS
jgi:hypothetical protein